MTESSKHCQRPRVVIITGMSGSGKTIALRAMEDIGFYCVDNMPVALLPKFLKVQAETGEVNDVALVMDLREKGFLDKYQRVFSRLKRDGYKIEIIFLDANDEVLLNRYSETRRVHPLAQPCSILESISLEREKLAPIKQLAHAIIDTSTINIHQLKGIIQQHFISPEKRRKLLFIHIISFGFRFGIPVDADLVFDVRFLPNPNFVKTLKNLDGTSRGICEFLLGTQETQEFMKKLFELMGFLLPLYEKEGKTRLNIAFGCTGGRHRSVFMAGMLGEFLGRLDYNWHVTHRDIDKE